MKNNFYDNYNYYSDTIDNISIIWFLRTIDWRSGSRQVTNAKEPDKLLTIKWAACLILVSSGSMAKSFLINSRVVITPIVTLLSTTGWIISRIARSTFKKFQKISKKFQKKKSTGEQKCSYREKYNKIDKRKEINS